MLLCHLEESLCNGEVAARILVNSRMLRLELRGGKLMRGVKRVMDVVKEDM